MPDNQALLGEWRVAGVGGDPVDQPGAISASILHDEIHAVAGCVRWNWGYRLRHGAIALERRPSATPPCLRPLTQAERDFEQAMHKASIAVRRSDGSLVVHGAGKEVVLFRQ